MLKQSHKKATNCIDSRGNFWNLWHEFYFWGINYILVNIPRWSKRVLVHPLHPVTPLHIQRLCITIQATEHDLSLT